MKQQSIQYFLNDHSLQNAKLEKIPGDASLRHYHRVIDGGKSYILMDSSAEKRSVKPFLNIAQTLISYGLKAPQIFFEDGENGFLLLEDLGNDSFTKILHNNPELELHCYAKAIEVLAEIRKKSASSAVELYSNELLNKELSIFIDWFLPQLEVSEEKIEEFKAIWEELLPWVHNTDSCLVLRDYHADNLMWLPQEEGLKKVGLLDFQDAVYGPCSYDLVSLLEDARRDLKSDNIKKLYDYYLELSPKLDKGDFNTSYKIMGAQRNLKIIGIFTRLAVRDDKPLYLKMLPRVWQNLKNDLEHSQLTELKNWLDINVPLMSQAHPVVDHNENA